MPAKILFQGESELLVRIEKAGQRIRWATQKALSTIGMRVTERAKEKVSGEVLHVRTGNLRRAIHTVQESMEQGTIRQLVGLSLGRVPYARIHEYGGVIHHPGSDKLQVFPVTENISDDVALRAGVVFTRRTRPHEIPMPERSYLRSSLAELAPWALDTIRGSILEALAK